MNTIFYCHITKKNEIVIEKRKPGKNVEYDVVFAPNERIAQKVYEANLSKRRRNGWQH